MFLGEYEHSIDSKGRLAIPVRFRALLGEGAVITRAFDGCLVIYPADVWRTVAEKLDSLGTAQEAARMAKRFVFSNASECEFDRQGRVVVPAPLRAYAGLTETAVVVGQYSRIEVWDRDRWTEISARAEVESTRIAEQLASLGLEI
ncbi:MAG TPA: division/cell wall cluster transcriptional repressor MraZ [Chloroflexota bacterium]|nr:division/cell wall cluster transcriptional repressor MraZ [Chloroflexota bacterium]